MLSDQLSQLWVSSANLLKDRLEHLRLLLDDLSELLELGIVSEEIKIAQSTSCGSSTCPSPSSTKKIASSTASSSRTTSSASASLSCCFKKIYRLITSFGATFSSNIRGSRCWGCSLSSWSGLSLLLLEILRDALVL